MITIRGLNIDLREFHLRDIDLDITENEFFILMGPTGAGKTVLLEAVAGLVPITSGTILIGDREITRLPPEKRSTSLVYQDYALFPHLTVMASDQPERWRKAACCRSTRIDDRPQSSPS